MKAVNVFADIRKRCNTADEPGTDDDAAAVAEDAQHESDEDPMMALDQVVELKPAPAPAPAAEAKAKAKPRGRPKGAARAKGKQRSTVYTFSMPKHPACSGWDPKVKDGELDIDVYKKKNVRYVTKEDEKGNGNAACLYPVSYTHLTLPTKA